MTLSLLFNPFTGTFDYVTVGAASVTPTIVNAGATYTIVAEQQLLYKHPIKLDGVLRNDGLLVSV